MRTHVCTCIRTNIDASRGTDGIYRLRKQAAEQGLKVKMGKWGESSYSLHSSHFTGGFSTVQSNWVQKDETPGVKRIKRNCGRLINEEKNKER